MDDSQKLPCADKVVFENKKTATGAAAAADWQHGASLKAYKCRHCGLWHLASRLQDE
jgi:hypothetical protein